MTEAVDHILATKLLRKIRDRHDTRPEDLEALRLAVEEAWPRLGSQGEPVKSTSRSLPSAFALALASLKFCIHSASWARAVAAENRTVIKAIRAVM